MGRALVSQAAYPSRNAWIERLGAPTSHTGSRSLVAEFADVDGIGREGHGFQVHGTPASVGAEEGTKKAAAEVKAFDVGLERELDRLRGEVADHNQDRGNGRDGLGLADPGKDVLIIMVESDGGTGVDGGVAVMKCAKAAVPVEERGWVGVLEGYVGGCVQRRCGGG